MNEKLFKFISKESLRKYVKTELKNYKEAYSSITLEDFKKTPTDPFKFLFDSYLLENKQDELITDEILRRHGKKTESKIGYFHQYIFEYTNYKKWSVPKKGWDLVNEEEHIYVEIKNKFNTMNSSSQLSTFEKMEKKIKDDSKATCYLLQIMAKGSKNDIWKISNKECHENIRLISIDKFLELITRESKMFYYLCQGIKEIVSEETFISTNNMKTSIDLSEQIKSQANEEKKPLIDIIFEYAFEDYEGFK